jgi:hypothetical protein
VPNNKLKGFKFPKKYTMICNYFGLSFIMCPKITYQWYKTVFWQKDDFLLKSDFNFNSFYTTYFLNLQIFANLIIFCSLLYWSNYTCFKWSYMTIMPSTLSQVLLLSCSHPVHLNWLLKKSKSFLIFECTEKILVAILKFFNVSLLPGQFELR